MSGTDNLDGHMRYLVLLLSVLVLCRVAAQPYDPEHPPNTYRNADNPHYWRNRPPRPGYWQQDVHYLIKARLNDSTDQVNAEMSLTYWNNSPDTLRLPGSGAITVEGALFHALSLKLVIASFAFRSEGITSSGFCSVPVASNM